MAQLLVAADKLVIIAAGNDHVPTDSTSLPSYPADIPPGTAFQICLLTVGSSSPLNRLSDFSNFGDA